MPSAPLRPWGDGWPQGGHILLNYFSEQLPLKILPIWQFCLLEPVVASPRKSDFVPWRRGSNTSNRSEVSANMTFLAKLSNKEIYLKNGS
jgi:hypothetical protein